MVAQHAYMEGALVVCTYLHHVWRPTLAMLLGALEKDQEGLRQTVTSSSLEPGGALT